MTFEIKRGKKRAWPFMLMLWFRRRKVMFVVRFTDSCRYDHPGTYDDLDVNKLFGIGQWSLNAPVKRWFFKPHHWKSVRYGWVSFNDGTIGVFKYWYDKGERRFEELYRCLVDTDYLLTIDPESIPGKVFFIISNPLGYVIHKEDVINLSMSGVFYVLNLRFGGNLNAPHDIRIHMKEA